MLYLKYINSFLPDHCLATHPSNHWSGLVLPSSLNLGLCVMNRTQSSSLLHASAVLPLLTLHSCLTHSRHAPPLTHSHMLCFSFTHPCMHAVGPSIRLPHVRTHVHIGKQAPLTKAIISNVRRFLCTQLGRIIHVLTQSFQIPSQTHSHAPLSHFVVCTSYIRTHAPEASVPCNFTCENILVCACMYSGAYISGAV